MTAAIDLVFALGVLAIWVAIAFPLAVLIGRAFKLNGEPDKPGYVIPPASETTIYYRERDDEVLPR